MRKRIKAIVSAVVCVCMTFSFSAVSFADTGHTADNAFSVYDIKTEIPPAPTWVRINTNADNTKTVVIKTPDYMLDKIDFYEYSLDGGLKWEILQDVAGTEIQVTKTIDFALRYTKDNVTSSSFMISVPVNSAVAATSAATGITLLISNDSPIPKDVTLAAYEIVNGVDYTGVKDKLGKNRPFKMYSVKIMRNGREYISADKKTWLFPVGDYDKQYTVLYHVSYDGKLERLDTEYEFGIMMTDSGYTGIFVVAEDRSYCMGDVNGDAAVNAADARLALRASANLEVLDEKQFNAADVDKNEKLTASDARTILRVAAKLEVFEN